MKLNMNIGGLVHGLRGRGGEVTQVANDLHSQVDTARREWQAAQQYFEMVSEPELVDHAIYTLEAAHRKYMYLFRQLRQSQGYPVDQEG